ncbi:MAG TPA: WbqC family protein, partial [Methanocella sp.]|nr:WbqC family protein [Methanocella sp.]
MVTGLKVAIHQPNYLPWLGYFKKMALADVFVLLDTVQFSRDSYTQRTRIRTKGGWMWLTIPVEKDCHFKPIRDVRMPRVNKWQAKHLSSIVSNYSRSAHFDRAFAEGYYGRDYPTLPAFNEAGIFYLKEKLGIKCQVIRASELDPDPALKSTGLLIDIVERAGGDTYISGAGGEKYMDAAAFAAHGIRLEAARYTPAEYPQRWGGFEPYMSAIDL